jgi:hypothetical protein
MKTSAIVIPDSPRDRACPDLAANPESMTTAGAYILGPWLWIPGSRPLAKANGLAPE